MPWRATVLIARITLLKGTRTYRNPHDTPQLHHSAQLLKYLSYDPYPYAITALSVFSPFT